MMHPNPDVRQLLAGDERTSRATLEVLSTDLNHGVAAAALERLAGLPKVPAAGIGEPVDTGFDDWLADDVGDA